MTQDHPEESVSPAASDNASVPAEATPASKTGRRRRPRRTSGATERSPLAGSSPNVARPRRQEPAVRTLHPALEQLAAHHPALFGATPRPLKRGIFHDLVQAHPDIPEEELKQALAQHTRSTRYLQGMASGQPRHDLALVAVEPVAVEHGFHALVEIFQRRQRRGTATAEQQEQARAWLERRLQQHILASGLDTQAYREAVQPRNSTVQAILTEAAARADERHARDEALGHIFEASQMSVADFAETYGLTLQEAQRVARQLPSASAAATAAAPAPADDSTAPPPQG